MSNTLKYSDMIYRTGFTIIDDIKVVQYTCVIPLLNPSDMRVTSTRLDVEMYKANRDACRSDLAAFEDAAYVLQEGLIAKMKGQE